MPGLVFPQCSLGFSCISVAQVKSTLAEPSGRVKNGGLASDNCECVKTYSTQRWFLRMTRFGVAISLGGGLLMLFVAAAAHDSASIPLLVIGGAWFIMGVAGLGTRRKVAEAVQLEDDRITFVFRSRRLTVPVREITEIRRPRYDINEMQWVEFHTLSNGKIRVSPRLRGRVDLVAELRKINPSLKIAENL